MANIQEEPAWDACVGLLYHLLTGKLANGNIRNDVTDLLRLRLLLADYARRSAALPVPIQADLNSVVIGYLAANPPQHLWAALGKTLKTTPQAKLTSLDVGIVTTSKEDLRATALAFDTPRTLPHHPGDPDHIVTLDCIHLAGRRLLVGIYRADDAQAGSLSQLVAHMRHRRIPRLVCLVGSTTSASTNVSHFDVVVPHRVYKVKSDRKLSEFDLTSADFLALRDPHLHGLEAYAPAHTGYYERLQSLLRRIPRQYRIGVRSNQIKPGFAASTCVAVPRTLVSSKEDVEQLQLAQRVETVCIVDSEAYEFAESLPGEAWLVFRSIRDSLPKDMHEEGSTYLTTAIAALCLRDFLENYYVPPGAADF